MNTVSNGSSPLAFKQEAVDLGLGLTGSELAGDDAPIEELEDRVGGVDMRERGTVEVRERVHGAACCGPGTATPLMAAPSSSVTVAPPWFIMGIDRTIRGSRGVMPRTAWALGRWTTLIGGPGMSPRSTLHIADAYLVALSKVFSPRVMDRLVSSGRSEYLAEVCLNAGIDRAIDEDLTVGSFLAEIYSLLVSRYRCEYVYKNEIVSKVVLGRHSLKTAQLLCELRVGNSKADLVIINGTSTAYEIKSEYDSFARLASQIDSYSRVFEHINVVTSPRQAEQVLDSAPDSVGVVVLTGRRTLSTARQSRSNADNIEGGSLFDLLRRTEYLSVIRRYYGEAPSVPNTRIHSVCRELFCRMPTDDAHRLTMEELSTRFKSDTLIRYLDAIPPALRAYAFPIAGDARRLDALGRLVQSPTRALLH